MKSLTFNVKYLSNQELLKTNMGEAINLRRDLLDAIHTILVTSQENIQDLYIGPPRRYTWITTIKARKYANLPAIEFKIDIPWMIIERKAEIIGENTKITDNIIVKHSYLPNSFIQKKEFKTLQDSLKKNYSNILLL